jgi:hypothetical protein
VVQRLLALSELTQIILGEKKSCSYRCSQTKTWEIRAFQLFLSSSVWYLKHLSLSKEPTSSSERIVTFKI